VGVLREGDFSGVLDLLLAILLAVTDTLLGFCLTYFELVTIFFGLELASLTRILLEFLW